MFTGILSPCKLVYYNIIYLVFSKLDIVFLCTLAFTQLHYIAGKLFHTHCYFTWNWHCCALHNLHCCPDNEYYLFPFFYLFISDVNCQFWVFDHWSWTFLLFLSSLWLLRKGQLLAAMHI